ncbi:MAG: 2,3-bisphosphoglycerate-dependent phosphoglycerate mutase [Candidatus Paceibacterota bacterium]
METQKMGKLVLIRHQESEWNKLGKWTGFTDISLSADGFKKAKEIGEKIKDFHFDYVFISTLKRTRETLEQILSVRNVNNNIPIEVAKEINERDYGDYTGKNKWEIEKELGHDEFVKLRRGWDTPITNGESLKMVYERSVPFFLNKILPILKEEKDVLIVAHGNSLRSIIKYIENISDEGVSGLEMDFGDVIFYDLDNNGHMLNKEVLKV